MGLKKTNKQLSRIQESELASFYQGRFSPSSGAQDHDRGDVRYDITVVDPANNLFNHFHYTGEAKVTRKKSFSLKKETWDKVAEEAAEQNRRPCMFIRFYDENTGKTLDLVVRDVDDDLEMLVR